MYNNMKFVKTHEWADIHGEGEKIATIGISTHASSLLGDIVYIELPKLGDIITANVPVGVIESVKSASDLYAPVSGEVIEINNEVINDVSLINQSPQQLGWLYKVRLHDAIKDEANLLDLAAYQAYIDAQ